MASLALRYEREGWREERERRREEEKGEGGREEAERERERERGGEGGGGRREKERDAIYFYIYIQAKQAIYWLKCLLSGLQYLFSYNIVHRDLKLDNLLLSGEGLKICDFGMALELDSTMVMQYMPGTSVYN